MRQSKNTPTQLCLEDTIFFMIGRQKQMFTQSLQVIAITNMESYSSILQLTADAEERLNQPLVIGEANNLSQ